MPWPCHNVGMKTAVKPNIYDYNNLPGFLKALYKYRKSTEEGFSYEAWAGEMGIRSRSYLRYLVLGEKPPTHSIIPALIKGLRLSEEELTYLTLLVNYQLATTDSMRALYLREIYKRGTRHLQESTIQDISAFLSDPLVPQLYTYLSFADSPSNLERWAQDFRSSVERIQNALKCLIWQNLVIGEIKEDGSIIYRTENEFFRIPSSPDNQYIRTFHAVGLKQAQEAVHGPTENRKLYSTFIALSADQFQKAQELIQEFNTQLLAIFNEKSIAGKKVYRLNQQILSVSEVIKSSSDELAST